MGGRATSGRWLPQSAKRSSFLGNILPTHEELGKKDDDHRPGPPGRPSAWATPFRRRRRRLLILILAVSLLYLLFGNFHGPGGLRLRLRPSTLSGDSYAEEPVGAPPGIKKSMTGDPLHVYDGEIKFYRLATTLRGAGHPNGYTRNVLFAFSSLQSASNLLPMACEMAKWNRNNIHAAFMGREAVSLHHLLEINGIREEECGAIWHDARPDYTEYSTDARASKAVAAAMVHINSFLQPQVVIHEDSLTEDNFFVEGIRIKASQLRIPIIEIPKDGWQNMMWITRLDAGSLRNWHKPTVDIVIQAPAGSAKGVIKLLKSLKEADYRGLPPPRLTIELPADVDGMLLSYLRDYDWPPHSQESHQVANLLTILRRMTKKHSTAQEAALQFMELFYPADPTHSHMLHLAQNAEVSPQYYHYLMYSILEYKYSAMGDASDRDQLLGLSLERPRLRLDDNTPLPNVTTKAMHTERYTDYFPDERNIPFLWRAAHTDASLYFGDKWAELQSFIRNNLEKQRDAATQADWSSSIPAWTLYMIELMQIRGYTVLYPAVKKAESLVKMHNEPYRLPAWEANDDESARKKPPKVPEPHLVPYSRPLHLALPFDGDLPELAHMPYLYVQGEYAPAHTADDFSYMPPVYRQLFMETVGDCAPRPGLQRNVLTESADDLFCFGDEPDEEWEEERTAFQSHYAGEKSREGYTDDAGRGAEVMLESATPPAEAEAAASTALQEWEK